MDVAVRVSSPWTGGGGGSVITNHMGIVTIYLRVLRGGRDENSKCLPIACQLYLNLGRLVDRGEGAYCCMKQRGPSHREEEKLNPFFSKLPQSSSTTSKFIVFFSTNGKYPGPL